MSDSVALFSTRPDDYAQFRPSYPQALFVWLAAQCPQTEKALDIAAGSGQASLGLSAHFQSVFACDASRQQLAAGERWGSVQRFAAQAEQLPLKAGQLDLIVVAQALHWFATPLFFSEARRIIKPGGLFCAWCYSLLRIDAELDALIEHLHGETLQGYWPAGRASVDAGYRDIQPPFSRIAVPDFHIEAHWQLPQLLGYLRTWSATKRWQQTHGRDPITALEPLLLRRWGDPQQSRAIRWPLHFLAGRPG